MAINAGTTIGRSATPSYLRLSASQKFDFWCKELAHVAATAVAVRAIAGVRHINLAECDSLCLPVGATNSRFDCRAASARSRAPVGESGSGTGGYRGDG